MPAKDKYHQTVKNALVKAGWSIKNEQIALKIPGRVFSVDLEALQQQTAIAVLVEIKVFENMPSPMRYLEAAIGQYMIYQAVIDWLGLNKVLYMAVPIAAYETIFREAIGQIAIKKLHLRLMVFNPETEEIERWI
jgi:glucose-6-phosphate 1-dehydrogenase